MTLTDQQIQEMRATSSGALINNVKLRDKKIEALAGKLDIAVKFIQRKGLVDDYLQEC